MLVPQQMKLGLFGGSFNPVHLGHLLVAQAAMEELGLDRLYFIPAAQSPFKQEPKAAPPAIRLRLLRLALAGQMNWEIDEQEIRRAGVSFTIETVRDYAKRFPKTELFYLIGADNTAKLSEWREANELARLVEFVIIPRPGEVTANLLPPFRQRILKGFPLAVSSSQIRGRVKMGLPIETLVPPPVAEAIREEKLYT